MVSPALSQENLAELDSLKKLSSTATGDSLSKIYVRISHLYPYVNLDSCEFYVSKAVEVAETDSIRRKMFFQLAMFYRFADKDMQQMNALDSVLAISENIESNIAAEALHYKHILFSERGFYQEGLKAGFQELEMRKALRNKDAELNAILQIGYTYERIGDYRKALEWFEKGFQVEGVEDQEIIGRNYGLIGITYDDMGDYQKAIEYNRKAIQYFEEVPNSTFLQTWYSNLGNTYIKTNQLDSAEKYTLRALDNPHWQPYVTKINLGKIYIEKKAYNKAEEILNEVVNELKEIDRKSNLSEAYYRLKELYENKGEYRKALEFMELHKEVEDKRLNEEKIKNINELTVQYETNEKEREILLQRAQIAERNLKIKKRNVWIMSLSFLAFMLVLVGFLLYKQEKIKRDRITEENRLRLQLKEIEKQKNIEEQKQSISRDLHDNIGAHLTFISLSIDTLKNKIKDSNGDARNKLLEINNFTKMAIHELRDTVWAMRKDQISLEDLRLRFLNFVNVIQNDEIMPEICIDNNRMNQLILFDSETGMNIYRILQEAVNNTIKHANAQCIKINFEADTDKLIIGIKDNGNGFDEETLNRKSGLTNMKNRTKQLNGKLKISSTAEGTYIVCAIPLKKQVGNE